MSYMCIIHQDQTASTNIEPLTAGLVAIGSDLLDDPEPAPVEWNTVAPTFMFTEGKPSTTSIVVRAVPADLDTKRRESLMAAVRDLWVDTTGCSVDEIVISLNPIPA